LQSHRTLTVGEHRDLLQSRRQEMQTETFEKEQRRRNGIEGTQRESLAANENETVNLPIRCIQIEATRLEKGTATPRRSFTPPKTPLPKIQP